MSLNGYLIDPTKHDVLNKTQLRYHLQSKDKQNLAHCSPNINLDLDTGTQIDDISKYAMCGRCKKQLSKS